MSSQSGDADRPYQIERGPLLTWLVCGVCVLVFLGLSQETDSSWRAVSPYGYLSPGQIWDGMYWGLVSSVFVHRELWHLAFNVYWLWALGSLLEQALGPLRWSVFFVTAALVSSGAQFAVPGSTGIGASGIGYAMFGYMWIASRKDASFQRIASTQMVALFLGWLVIGMLATFLNFMSIANTAHVAGLAFGAGVAALFVLQRGVRWVTAGLAGLIIASIIPLFWCPWSASWLSKQGYAAHLRGDYGTAIRYYARSIDRGGDLAWALSNMATAYRAIGNRSKYEETLTRLREVDEEAAQEIEEASTKEQGQ